MPTASSFPPIQVPNKDLYSFIYENPDRPFPDSQVIFIDGSTRRQLTYGDLRTQATAFGIGLKSIWGWRKGDVLAMFSTNQIETGPLMSGVHWASGVVTPANPGYTVEELTFQLRDSGAKALATLPELLPVAAKAAENVGIPRDRIILLGEQRSREFKHWREITDPSTAVKWRRTKVDPAKDLAFLVYSSGTTGHPKGVMLSHTNVAVNVLQTIQGDTGNLTWQNDKIIAFLPFFHIYGLTCLVHLGAYAGRTTVVMSRFDLEKFCQLVQEYRITYAFVVPPVVLLLAKSPVVSKYDLSSMRMMNSGAAPLTRDLVQALYDRVGLRVKQGYGLSETSPVTHTQNWKDWHTAIGSVGTLLPNLTAKYISETGEEVPAGETGELWMKGPNVMLGYLNNPEATKNALTEDGYFKTGDVGHQDADGNFYITDRVKELIKYKGFQVPPAELEGILLGNKDVVDCAVIGMYDEVIASEVPRAYVVADEKARKEKGDQKLGEELEAFVRERVAQHKRLRGGVRFVDAIPKSVSGKVLRRLLKAQAAEELKKAKEAADITVKAKL